MAVTWPLHGRYESSMRTAARGLRRRSGDHVPTTRRPHGVAGGCAQDGRAGEGGQPPGRGKRGSRTVRDVKVVPRPADDGDRRHAEIVPDRADARDERTDRLLVRRDERLHPGVADHEVGRRSVLVDEKRARSTLEGLDDRRRLRASPTQRRSAPPLRRPPPER